MALVRKWTLQYMFYICLLIATFSIPPSRTGNNSLTPSGTVCVCSGVEIVYECSVCSGATTLWSGTTLDCVTNDIITLRHNSDNFQPGTFDYCNGDITSEIVGIEENCYISRVNFTTMARFNNTSIDCSLQDPLRSSIGNSTIFIPASDYLPEPSGFMVSSVNMTGITISWTDNSLCSELINYNVASNCSSIRCTTRRNEATCSNLPIATMCSFSIRSVICRQMETIAVNNAITVTLRRPRVDITPVYSPGSPSTLTKVIITIYPEPFLSVAGDGPSPIINYSFSYSNSKVNIPGCQESCQRSIDLPCPPSTETDVTLSASNMLGLGPSTDPTTIGCTNKFVRVDYDSAESTITCNFLDEMDLSIKSCFFQQCDQMLVSSPGHVQNSTMEAPNSIILNVATGDSDCFLVTASNNSFTIAVEIGTSMGTGNDNTKGIVIGVIVGVTVVIIIIVVILVIIVLIVKFKKKSTKQVNIDSQPPWEEIKSHGDFRVSNESLKLEIIEKFQLQKVPKSDIRGFDINKDYELAKLTKEVKSQFKVGRIFCEFKGKLEDIPKPKPRKVIFMNKQTIEFFSSNVTSLNHDRDLRGKITDVFKIFIENMESVETILKAETSVLYEVKKTEKNTGPGGATVTSL